MCEVTRVDKLSVFQTLLLREALSYYVSHVRQADSYEEATGAIQESYNNADKYPRILIICRSIWFTVGLMNNINDSTVEETWKVVTKLKPVQKKLDLEYRRNKLHRDRLTFAVNILPILISLRGRFPWPAQQPADSMAKRKSKMLNTDVLVYLYYE